MGAGVLEWLANVGDGAFRWSLMAFVVVNGIAVAAVIITRDRALVNRWTGRLLGVNLLLAGTGIGIPLMTTVTRLAVAAALPGTAKVVPQIAPSDGALEVQLRAKD